MEIKYFLYVIFSFVNYNILDNINNIEIKMTHKFLMMKYDALLHKKSNIFQEDLKEIDLCILRRCSARVRGRREGGRGEGGGTNYQCYLCTSSGLNGTWRYVIMAIGLLRSLKFSSRNIISVLSDYTKGIFQSIGFKEFHPYLVLSEEERASEKGKKLLQQGIDDLKLVTKRYAKKQDKWVMNRLIRRGDRQVPPIYSLDCTDVRKWDSHVLKPAEDIISAIMRGEKPKQRPLNEDFENQKTTDSSTNTYHYCEVCEKIFVEDNQWQIHLKGAKHMNVLKKKKRAEARAQAQENQLTSS
ncbi:hypothetical protein ACFW04_010928 [Cataglyphis niger]